MASIIVRVTSIIPQATYRGEVFGQAVTMQLKDQVFVALDSYMLAHSEHLGQLCKVDLVACLGEIEFEESRQPGIEALNPHHVIICGRLMEMETQLNTQTSPTSTDVELLLDIGDGTIRSSLVHWPYSNFSLSGLIVGTFITHHRVRIDLRQITIA